MKFAEQSFELNYLFRRPDDTAGRLGVVFLKAEDERVQNSSQDRVKDEVESETRRSKARRNDAMNSGSYRSTSTPEGEAREAWSESSITTSAKKFGTQRLAGGLTKKR